MRSLALGLLALLLVPAVSFPQEPKAPSPRPPRADRQPTVPVGQLRVFGRIAVGEPAPAFELPSSGGRDLSTKSLRGDWVLLVFARDRRDFAPLREIHDEMLRIGVRVFGLCTEKPHNLRATALRDSLPFELLADATGEVSAIYGLYDPSERMTQPGVVVVDRQGIVRLTLQGKAPPRQVAELTRFTVVGFTSP